MVVTTVHTTLAISGLHIVCYTLCIRTVVITWCTYVCSTLHVHDTHTHTHTHTIPTKLTTTHITTTVLPLESAALAMEWMSDWHTNHSRRLWVYAYSYFYYSAIIYRVQSSPLKTMRCVRSSMCTQLCPQYYFSHSRKGAGSVYIHLVNKSFSTIE